MMNSKAAMIIMGIFIMILSIIPMLSQTNISISGFSIGDRVQDSNLPQNPMVYFGLIFVLGLIAVIYGMQRHNIIVH